MGVEFYIADTLNKTFYDLGKGNWRQLGCALEMLADLELLKEWVCEECFPSSDAHISDIVVPELHRFFGQTPITSIRIFDDCGDDIVGLKVQGYRCVGTRYYKRDSVEHRKVMESNNRHLTPEWRARYAQSVQT